MAGGRDVSVRRRGQVERSGAGARRLRRGSDPRLLLPSAALAGGAFLLVCDTAARSLLGGRELPVGAITSLLGGPVFLWLLRRHQQRIFAP